MARRATDDRMAPKRAGCFAKRGGLALAAGAALSLALAAPDAHGGPTPPRGEHFHHPVQRTSADSRSGHTSVAPLAGLPRAWCGNEAFEDRPATVDPSRPQIKVYYARPPNRANRFRQFADLMQATSP